MPTRTIPRTRLFFDRCTYPSRRESLVQRGLGLEESAPWRRGPVVIVRAPLTRMALAVGIWTSRAETEEDQDGLFLALREVDWEEFERNVQEQQG